MTATVQLSRGLPLRGHVVPLRDSMALEATVMLLGSKIDDLPHHVEDALKQFMSAHADLLVTANEKGGFTPMESGILGMVGAIPVMQKVTWEIVHGVWRRHGGS